jgi:YfiH family protein
VSVAPFLYSEKLARAGVDHGLGTRASAGAVPPGVLMVRQVHGNRTLRVPPLTPDAAADALLSLEPGTGVAVRTADCVPILLFEPGRRAVAAVHAGWRGSAARISEIAVREIALASGGRVADLIAVVGPHIGPCCYEVDEPVREAISEGSVFAPSRRPGHYQLDLYALNRLQLVRAGVRPEQIERVGDCTACQVERFASYRRDGSPGRMVHYIRVPK